MPAYVIADITVTDAERYKEYAKLVPATIDAYGGKYLVRGGAVETQEGNWSPQRFVVIEFADAAHAKAWLDSEAYRPVKAIRHQSAISKIIVVEGV